VRLVYIPEDGNRWAEPASLGVQPNQMMSVSVATGM
jgi:hypothetical protein